MYASMTICTETVSMQKDFPVRIIIKNTYMRR